MAGSGAGCHPAVPGAVGCGQGSGGPQAKAEPCTERLAAASWQRRGAACCSQGPLGVPGGSVGKDSACSAGLVPGSGRSAGEGIGYPLPYSWASLVAQLVKTPPAVQV